MLQYQCRLWLHVVRDLVQVVQAYSAAQLKKDSLMEAGMGIFGLKENWAVCLEWLVLVAAKT